jgi:predicted Na+-dependent transporter
MAAIINLLATITLIEMMVTIGLGVTVRDVLGVALNWRRLGQAALANYVCVPAIALGLLLFIQPPSLAAAGILIAAVCPGG